MKMASDFGRFAGRARALGRQGAGELRQIFGAWLDLPETFGKPLRKRLFFPLTNLLAVFVAGAFG